MAQELEFSVISPITPVLQALLGQFEARYGIHVRVRELSWDSAWNDLFKSALHNDTADLSEVGSSWLGDLVAMRALQSFSASELAALQADTTFVPAAWRGTRLLGQTETWAIPWMMGARLLFYRRSLLTTAGVDEATAFTNADALDRTLGRLQAAGVAIPWTVPLGSTHTTLLNVASWVWGAGGDFLSADGKRVQFSLGAARTGLRRYFALGRYLAPAVRRLTGSQPDDMFLHNPQAGATISGSWLFLAARGQASGELAAQLGVTTPPGPSFVGGSHLVIWQHTRQREAALQLVRFLASVPAQVRYCEAMGLLPVTAEAQASPPFSTDPLWQQTIRAAQTGRSFPVTRTWGLMEYRLVAGLNALWAETMANPAGDIDAAIRRHLDPLAVRLEQLIGQG